MEKKSPSKKVSTERTSTKKSTKNRYKAPSRKRIPVKDVFENMPYIDVQEKVKPKSKSYTQKVYSNAKGTTNKVKPWHWILLIIIGIAGIEGIISKVNENKTPPVKQESTWKDPGMYDSGSNDWPYYGKTNDQLIRDLNDQFYGRPKTVENEQFLYNKVGGMLLNNSGTTSIIRRYDLLEVPISMSYVLSNGEWRYGRFIIGGVKEGDPRLYK